MGVPHRLVSSLDVLQKRTHSFYYLHTRDEGLASPALIYLEVAADEAGFHFIIAFDKIDDEYILYIAVAITILDIEKLNLYTHDKTHRTSKCHLIGDTDQEDQRARRESRIESNTI